MPLQSQVISIPFTQGMDSKTDPKLSAKPSRMEDAVFVGGTIQKRPGTKSLPNTTAAGGTLTSGGGIFTLNKELVRLGTSTAYGFASDVGQWIPKSGGEIYTSGISTPIQSNTRTQSDLSQCSVNGTSYFAWAEYSAPQRGIHVAVMDESTGNYWQYGDTALSGTSTYTTPKCLVIGNKVVVAFGDQTNGVVGTATFTPASPSASPTIRLAIISGMYTGIYGTYGAAPTPRFDACSMGTIGFGAFTSDATGVDIVVFTINSDGTTGSNHTYTGVTTANSGGNLRIIGDTNQNMFIVFGDYSVTPNTYYMVIDQSYATVKAKTLLSALQVPVFPFAVVESSANVISAIFNSSLGNSIIKATASESAAVASASVPMTLGVYVATDAFLISGEVAFGATYSLIQPDPRNIQPTAFIINSSTGAPIARFLAGLSSGIPTVAIPFVSVLGSDFSLLFGKRGRLAYSSVDGQSIDVTPIGFERVLLSVVDSSEVPVTKTGRTAYIGGWLPRCYDGHNITEAGISLPSITPTHGSTGGGGGSLGAGDYQVCVLYSWVDAQGQLIRGPVSPTVSFTASASDAVVITAYPMPVSSRDILPPGFTVQIEFYRTEANGAIFYRDSSASSPKYNSSTTVTFTCTQSDANLITNEILYTTGGVLDWLSPPPYTVSCNHKDRLIIAGLEDPYAWQSSTAVIDGEAVRFNEALGGSVPRETGAITGLASMDGNLIIFVEQGAYLVTGDGPDNSGNNNWPSPQLITSVESGAVSWQSIVQAAGAGVFFQSKRGFMLLDRGLGCTYIGADVEKFSNFTCRGGTLIPGKQWARFLVDLDSDLPGTMTGTMVPDDGGLALNYDYFYRQWSIFPSYNGVCSTLYNGNFTRISGLGVVRTDAPDTYRDDNETYSSYVETPWIKTAGLQGFERLYLAIVMGEYESNFTLNWGAAYNYVLDYSADTLSQNGAGVYDVGSVFQVRRRPRIQKCEAVKFLFWDSNIADSGQGMSLTDLSLEVGVKKGGFRLPSSQSI